MAIIQLARRNSVSETALKVLDAKTQSIILINGRILLSQFSDGLECATKLSLYVGRGEVTPDSRVLGERNVWLRDANGGLMIYYGHEKESYVFIQMLHTAQVWEQAFPDTHRKWYNPKHLDKAAEDMRNFLLLGALPSEPLTDEEKDRLGEVLTGYEIDVVASLNPDLVYFGEM